MTQVILLCCDEGMRCIKILFLFCYDFLCGEVLSIFWRYLRVWRYFLYCCNFTEWIRVFVLEIYMVALRVKVSCDRCRILRRIFLRNSALCGKSLEIFLSFMLHKER